MSSSDSSVDVRVSFEWGEARTLTLDRAGRLAFPDVAARPGLYRITLTSAPAPSRSRVYIGETDNLRRRFSQYRNPGPTQWANQRLHALLHQHLTNAGTAEIATAEAVDVAVTGNPTQPLDLARKSNQLLAENAALLVAQSTGRVDPKTSDLDGKTARTRRCVSGMGSSPGRRYRRERTRWPGTTGP